MGRQADGWADEHTGGRGLRADKQTGGRMDGRADEGGHARRTSGRVRTMGGRVDRQTGAGGRVDELAEWRTGGRVDDGFPKVKLLI